MQLSGISFLFHSACFPAAFLRVLPRWMKGTPGHFSPQIVKHKGFTSFSFEKKIRGCCSKFIIAELTEKKMTFYGICTLQAFLMYNNSRTISNISHLRLNQYFKLNASCYTFLFFFCWWHLLWEDEGSFWEF